MPLDSHELPDGRVVKLGRTRPSLYDDPRTHNVFRLARYVDRAMLGDPPEFVDNTECLQPIMGANDRMGDCLLPGVLVTTPGLQRVYRIPYSGPVVELTTASGKRLTVTRNHLVLTTRGFVRAGELHEGDDVLSSDLPQAVSMRVDDNFQDVPTPIEDVFETHCRVGSAISTPTGHMQQAIDFHGDARFFKGKIDVVDTDRFLQHGNQATLSQPECQLSLPTATRSAHAFNSCRTPFAHLRGIQSPTTRRLCGQSVVALPLRGVPSRTQRRSFLERPYLHAVGLDPLPHQTGIGTELTRDLYESCPGLIAPDRIVNVCFRAYSGHVYDVSTQPQWYIANGIISHNCVVVGEANYSILASTMVGQSSEFTDQDCVSRYSRLGGYDPATGANDNGLVEVEALNDWRKNPFDGVSLLGYASIDVHDLDLIRHAIDLFAAVLTGISLPNTAKSQTGANREWDVVAGTVPGDWGGHCVIIPYLDWRKTTKWFRDATWAFYQPMTEAFWRACGDEVYAPLPSVWLEHPRNGVKVDLLKQDLAALGRVA